MEFDGSGTARTWHGLRDEVGASGHLRAKGCPGSQEAVLKLVQLGASGAGPNRRTARARPEQLGRSRVTSRVWPIGLEV